MKKINIIKIIEAEGYKVLEFNTQYKKAWATLIPEPASENELNKFQAYIDLEINGYGDLVITLESMLDKKILYDGFEPVYEPVGRPKNDIYIKVQDYKKNGQTQEYASRELNVSLSTIRRNWK